MKAGDGTMRRRGSKVCRKVGGLGVEITQQQQQPIPSLKVSLFFEEHWQIKRREKGDYFKARADGEGRQTGRKNNNNDNHNSEGVFAYSTSATVKRT